VALRNAVTGSEVAFGLVPEVLDPVDMVSPGCEFFLVVDAVMMEFRDIENVAGSKAIAKDDAVGFDPLTDNCHPSQ